MTPAAILAAGLLTPPDGRPRSACRLTVTAPMPYRVRAELTLDVCCADVNQRLPPLLSGFQSLTLDGLKPSLAYDGRFDGRVVFEILGPRLILHRSHPNVLEVLVERLRTWDGEIPFPRPLVS